MPIPMSEAEKLMRYQPHKIECSVCGGPLFFSKTIDAQWDLWLKVEPCEGCLKRLEEERKNALCEAQNLIESLTDHIQTVRDGFLACPDCLEKMVKTNIECEDGSGWYSAWLCGCKPSEPEG